MLIMGLRLRQSRYHCYPLIGKSIYLPFLMYYKRLCCSLHVNMYMYIVYQHFNTQMHIAPSKPRFFVKFQIYVY